LSGVLPAQHGVTLVPVPTTKPRYAITDTAAVARTLDDAARRWPDLADDRKALLLRVLEIGARTLAAEGVSDAKVSASERRMRVTRRLPDLVDVGALLDDAAWR
jgi:hypothetical protein